MNDVQINSSAKFIIIGQGLAGSILAYFLLQEGQEVQIIDTPEFPSSSKVAAGLYNPVTGRKLVKTWLADKLFPFLEYFYAQLEKELNAKFFHPQAIYRPFVNEDSQKYFKSDHVPDDFSDFGTLTFDNVKYQNIVNSQLGGVTTKHSGWVDLKVMLSAFRSYFLEKGILKEENFSLKNEYENQKVIFCEGFEGRNNPHFNYLPFNPVKGEILDIEIENIELKEIINQGAFVVPLGENKFRLGATYSWHDLDFTPTEQGKNDLIEKYQKLMKPSMRILAHNAGVRPATKDRRPLIGLHPEIKNIGIFNGLGSKGVSLAPYFAKQFVDFLVYQKELQSEVNINRFASLYLGVDKV
ncbi:glycine/D-amino acid oxidase-like deaminating enzyme [Arcicella aurantiaca]|uniref:Glycine/D-amino acid oxidase-like deaminating enzyme n=1 Tax=Arcicella aurantiaca TaxID=591202 RepID=A0A316ECC1_9BACT|nr:FAD-binding oxidoreductase [Arcicella aurantiaca]PWK28164.1 glycine/D-amino acid oxidase-like deaminating enzyme [Arcicella aurantiaca]